MGLGRSVDNLQPVYQDPLQNPLTLISEPIPGVAIPQWANTAAVVTALGTDLLEFFDADDAAKITLVGSHVSAWAGEKATTMIPAQATDANRPIYGATQWNAAKPSIAFGNTTKRLNAPNVLGVQTGKTPFELWAVLDQQNIAGTGVIFNWPSTTAGQNIDLRVFRSGAANTLRVSIANNDGTNKMMIFYADGFLGKHIVRVRVELAQVLAGLDSDYPANKMPAFANDLGTLGATGVFSMGAGATGGSIWTGEMRKVLTTKLLTDLQAASLYNYLTTQL